MATIPLLVTAWLGSMFLYSAGLKLARYDRAGGLVKPYAILPPPLAAAAGFVLPWVELATGVLLLFGQLFPAGPVLGAVLGASFAYGSLRVLRRRADVPCGCAGATDDRVNRTTLIRAMVIMTSGLLLLGADEFTPSRLPLSVAVSLVLLSLSPAGLSAYRRGRDARRRQRRAQHLREEFVRLRRVLAAPPPAPALDGLAHGAASPASPERAQAVGLRPAL